MRKKMSRFIAGILFACMVAGSIPAEAVYGADNVAGNSQESEQNQSGAAGNTTVTDEEQLPGGNEEIQDNADDNEQKTEEEASEEPEGTFIDNEESDVPGNENDILPASDGDSAAEATAGESEEAERAEINFVYIESPYLETPGTQRIVFSFDREITESESVTLTVEDETGIQEEWGLAQRTDHLYLFEKEYTGDSYAGTYHAVSLNFHDGQNDSIILEDAGVEAEFGVNEKYDGIEELQPVDDSAVTEAEQSQVEASVVTIDENGVTQAQDSIADALNAVSVQNASANGISMFSADVSTGARTARAGDIVVALDPGHDANDAGAQGFGLREEDLTLKIANYCKEELEQYSGVSVYMTRTTAECPFNCTSAGSCIAQRAQAAAAAGAQIFVSFHLNASVSSSANGAEIIVPNYNWKYEVGAQGHALAEKILAELTALGLANRGIYSKDTTINERYPDGSLSDYFSVMIYNKENGIPGIIVEHAFLSNSGDVNKFLTTEAGLKQLGVADATGIANYLGLARVGEHVEVEEGTYTIQSSLVGEKIIEIPGNSWDNGTVARLNSRNDEKSSQRFEVISTGDGYYNIIAEHSGKALEIRDGSDASGAYIQQSNWNKTSQAQKWCFINAGNGEYYIASALGTYIDVWSGLNENGTPIWTYTFNGSEAQKWILDESNYKPIEEGTYLIANGGDNSKVVEVAGDALDNYANIQLSNSDSSPGQRFEVTYIGGGYYKILSEQSGKSLDIFSGLTDNGTKLQQYTWNGSNAQLWKFINAGNGKYYIRSKIGTVIGTKSNSTVSGTQVCMYEMDKNNSTQQWELSLSDYRPIENGKYVIRNVASTYNVLTINKSNAEVGTYAGTSNQIFEITYVEDGYYKIISSASSKSLDVQNGSSANNANLWEYAWNGSDSQLWKFIQNSDGSYYIKSKLGTVIDISGGVVQNGRDIQMYTINGTSAQKWVLDPEIREVNERPIENGTYTIANSSNESQVLDVNSGYENDGTNVQTYVSNDTSAQRFEVYYVGDGYYQIIAEHSGKSLDIANGSTAVGANVWQYAWNGSDAQLWKIIDAGNGAYYLQSKLGNVLDINGNVAISGSNVQMSNMKTSSTQLWKFVESSYRPISDGLYTLRSASHPEYAVDIANSSTMNTANAWIYYYNGTKAQQFEVEYVDNGYYKISAKHSGKVLDVANGSRTSGTNVWQYTWDGSDAQLWKFVKTSKGYYIRSKTGNVLDIFSALYTPYTNIQTYEANGSDAQKWNLVKEYESAEITDGVYTFRTALNSGRVLDITSAATSNYANVQIYTDNNTQAQKFEVIEVSDGYYKIVSKVSGKVLDIANGSRIAGANVWQYEWNGSDAQLWRFIDAGNDAYYIQSKLGTVLDVSTGLSAAGTNVQVYTLNYTTAQKWVLDSDSRALSPIMGQTSVTVDQMVKFFMDRTTVAYPYSKVEEAPTIEKFCEIYIDECENEGVKAEVAFSQAMMETGFLKFGGDVKKEQYNFAGLGAVGGGVSGASFSSIREEIRAQVQHLKAYASEEPLNQVVVDPRFQYVKRGSAEYVEWLGQKENPNGYGWATAKNYGYNIVDLYLTPLKTY